MKNDHKHRYTPLVWTAAGTAVVIFAVAACLNAHDPGVTIITFQTPFASETSEFEQLKVIVDHFNEQPGALRVELLPDGPSQAPRIIRRILAGKAPHIMEIPLDELEQIAERKAIQPVNLNSEPDEVFFSPGSLAPAAYAGAHVNGETYAAPVRARGVQLIYNADLLETRIATWRQMLVTSDSLKRRFAESGIHPFGLAGRDDDGIAQLAMMLVHQAGGELIERVPDEDNAMMWRMNLQDDSDSGARALKFLSDLAVYSPPESARWRRGDLLQAFADGRVAMFYGTSADVSRIRKTSPELPVAVMSAPRETAQASTVQFYGAIVTAPPEYRKQCERFLRYLVSVEAQTMIMYGGTERDEGFPVFEKVRIAPIARPDINEIEWYARHPQYRPFAEALMYARSPMPIAGWREVERAAFIPQLQQLLSGETDVDTAVEEMTGYGNQKLSTYYGYIGHVYPTTVLGMSLAAVFVFFMIFLTVGHRSRHTSESDG